VDTLDPARLDPAAILGRPELATDLADARRALSGRRILVTGAGGSVGANLAELLIGLQPAHLTLLDHHDHALFSLKRRLEAMGDGGTIGSRAWQLALADVRDAAKLARILDEARPDAVFHLAAYKHVPFGEEFPEETFAVNVSATTSLLELCGRRAVERFVYPSSDKAVNPPSLYGATKRLAEVLVQRAASELGRAFAVARYVNILGTRGSVIETFAEQLAAGRSLTVTDASMSRYWITMREATWLLVQAAALGEPGSVVMLDAPDEIPTVAIARRVESLLAPGMPERPISFTGLRPGERLREELLTNHEWFDQGPRPGILEVRNDRRDAHVAAIAGHLDGLRALAARGDGTALKAAAMEAARALQ
jgi:FlaA1/EpsC-like NDP-sugar epimerase